MSRGIAEKDGNCDVVIIGLGPVGAAMAALLTQKGLSVIVAERSTDIYPLPRAVGFDSEVMRIFQHLGIADEAAKHTRCPLDYQFRSAKGELLMNIERPIIDEFAWSNFVTFHQPAVEILLRDAIEASGGRLLLGYTFSGLDQDDDGVWAQLESADETIRVRAKYLVGCDGGKSAVRANCDIGLEDLGFEEPWLVVDFKSKDFDGLPDRSTQICDPKRPATYIRMGEERYRWEFMLLDEDDPTTIDQDDSIFGLLAQRGITRRDPIERRAIYTFHGLIAKQWRKSRVFLAGDAAHQTPPFAGQGMCSGIRDALNLSWKLHEVLRGAADSSLLDSYETERRPQVRFIIETAIRLGRIVCTTDHDAALQRDARMIADREAGKKQPPTKYPPLEDGYILRGTPGAGEMFPQPFILRDDEVDRFDDVMGDGPWLITKRPNKIESSQALAGRIVVKSVEDEDLARFGAQLNEWLDSRKAEAVLVRPDFHVFGTGAAEKLEAAYFDMNRKRA